MRNRKEFEGADLNDLNRSCAEILIGGLRAKPVNRVFWMNH